MSRSRKDKKAPRSPVDQGRGPEPAEPEPPVPHRHERASPPRRWGRRTVRIAAIAAIVAVYLGVQALIFVKGEKPSGEPRAVVVSSAPTANPPPTTPRTAITAEPKDDYVPGGLTGPGLTRPGILVQAEPNAQGDLEVVEQVRFTTPTLEVTIGPPSSRGVTGNAAGLKPRVKDLQVSADGELVNISTGSAVITESRTIPLTREARTLILRYHIEGAASRSIPGPPGRALVLLPPISSAPSGSSLPVVVTVSGRVHNLLCPALGNARQLCGRSVGGVWFTTDFGAGTTAVLAQVDLPPPGA